MAAGQPKWLQLNIFCRPFIPQKFFQNMDLIIQANVPDSTGTPLDANRL